jgi:hypothetical protein
MLSSPDSPSRWRASIRSTFTYRAEYRCGGPGAGCGSKRRSDSRIRARDLDCFQLPEGASPRSTLATPRTHKIVESFQTELNDKLMSVLC